MPRKPTFFERLTGTIRLDEYDPDVNDLEDEETLHNEHEDGSFDDGEGIDAYNQIPEEGTLNVDVYETPNEIIVKTMCAGVRPEDLEVSITREQITISGERHEDSLIDEDSFYARELYWGSFSRTFNLPAEVEPEESEAVEKHGLLIIRLPKIQKDKQTRVKVKSA